MPLRLVGTCERSAVWCEVRRRVDRWFDTCPPWAAAWTLVVRPKTADDDEMLVEDGEADDPTHYWAVFVDAAALQITVAVPPDAEGDEDNSAGAAGMLVELLCTVADPSDL